MKTRNSYHLPAYHETRNANPGTKLCIMNYAL